ncbi:MAG: hypothetical protein ACK4GN_03370 [Runella sp.]
MSFYNLYQTMLKGWYYIAIIFVLPLQALAQSPFVATWNFNNSTPNGTSNNPNVSTGGASLVNVQEAGYPSGAISIRLWPSEGFDGNKYVEVSVSPQNYQMTVSSISFQHNRSEQGPTQISVRSNEDNFGSDIGSASVGTSFNTHTVNVGYSNRENPVVFRIYAHSAPSHLGTLRLDNININGTVTLIPLPVEWTYFRGQHFENQAQLSWETAWERNASHFEVQRSSDLKEFVTLDIIKASGDTRTQSRYVYTDVSPLPGLNYYRLRQVDKDGAFSFSKIIAVNIDLQQPQIWVYGNPTSKHSLKVRLHLLQPDDIQLFNTSGQRLDFTYSLLGANEYQIFAPTPSGWYWLVGQKDTQRVSQKVLLID